MSASLRAALVRIAGAAAVVGLLVLLDHETKRWASSELRRRGPRTLIDGHLTLRFQMNSGIAFGMFQRSLHPQKRAVLVGYSAAVSVVVSALLIARLARRRVDLAGVGLAALAAGALGNLIDRVELTSVIDFIDVTLFGTLPWPSFNFADAYLAVGIVLCAVALARSAWRGEAAG